MGVSILPRLAAAVSRTRSSISARAFPSPEISWNSSSVKGTNVTRVTSLVSSILIKKLSSTNTVPTVLTLANFFRSDWQTTPKTPV